MLPYYLLILIPLIIYLTGYYNGKRWDKQCIVSFFIILILMLALRGLSCGRDLKMYLYFYEKMSSYSIIQAINYSQKGEILYFLFNKLASMVGCSFQLFLFIIAVISLLPIMLFYSKKSKNGLLTIALFLTVAPFPMFFSGMRQSIAMGLTILSFKFIEEKKPIKYIICILAITLFHKSASIALLFYPIYHAKITKNWLYVIISSFILVYIFKQQIFLFFLNFSDPIYKESYGVVSTTGQYSILLLLVIFVVYSIILPNKNKIDKELNGFRNLLLLSTLIQLFVPINMSIMRLNYYSLLFVPVLISKVPYAGEKKNNRLLQLSVIVMIVFFLTYFIYNGYTGNNSLDIFPYIPYWR